MLYIPVMGFHTLQLNYAVIKKLDSTAKLLEFDSNSSSTTSWQFSLGQVT